MPYSTGIQININGNSFQLNWSCNFSNHAFSFASGACWFQSKDLCIPILVWIPLLQISMCPLSLRIWWLFIPNMIVSAEAGETDEWPDYFFHWGQYQKSDGLSRRSVEKCHRIWDPKGLFSCNQSCLGKLFFTNNFCIECTGIWR